MDNNRFTMGKIVNTHGVRGDVKVYNYAQDIEVFTKIKNIDIEDVGMVQVKGVKFVKNMVVLNLKGYDDIGDVGVLMDKELYIKRDELETITGNTEGHYVVDLIGCELIDHKLGRVGVVQDVLQHTAQDI